MNNTLEVYNSGIKCLIENLGLINTEEFISIIKRENFDYTKWQKEYFDNWEDGKFANKATAYSKQNEYKGNGKILTKEEISC